MPSKDELRASMRTRLRGLDAATRARASAAICAALSGEIARVNPRLICAFVPLSSEPAIAELWAGETSRAFCFPRVRGEALELVRIDDRALLARATWRLDEPAFLDLSIVAPASVDLVLVPGLAFTRAGERLGRGRGHYDRLLAQISAPQIGVCFAAQLLTEVPTEPHDRRVQRVVTESGFA